MFVVNPRRHTEKGMSLDARIWAILGVSTFCAVVIGPICLAWTNGPPFGWILALVVTAAPLVIALVGAIIMGLMQTGYFIFTGRKLFDWLDL